MISVLIFVAAAGADPAEIGMTYADCVSVEAGNNFRNDKDIEVAVSAAEGLCAAALEKVRSSYRGSLLEDPKIKELAGEFPEEVDRSVDSFEGTVRRMARAGATAMLQSMAAERSDSSN